MEFDDKTSKNPQMEKCRYHVNFLLLHLYVVLLTKLCVVCVKKGNKMQSILVCILLRLPKCRRHTGQFGGSFDYGELGQYLHSVVT